MANKTKLYCFVDETGQDTKGQFFLVAVVFKETKDLAQLEKALEELEIKSAKRRQKWSKTKISVKKEYLKKIVLIKGLRKSIYYSTYKFSKEYSKLTSLTIAKTVLDKNYSTYDVSIVIDGLNNSEKNVVTKELKSLKIKYRKVRGMKDEQSVFLRLADSMAGFLRDANEGQSYAKAYLDEFIQLNIVKEI